ncbi:MAG: diphthine--ammonia ligase [Dehalococcoidia bacterium]|jgi:uncharacterized protein (TIGR00290 family)
MQKILFGWSGGKDSTMALYEIKKHHEYEVVSLLTTVTKDYDRISMHGVRRVLVEQQAKSIGIPLHKVFIPKNCTNEIYVAKMTEALNMFKEQGIEKVGFGDIFLEDVRKYREDNLAKLNMKGIFPIWGRDSAELAHSFIALGFKSVISCIDTKVLDQKFLGRQFDEDFLAELPPNIDPSGENGEFHSFAYDGPIFQQGIGYSLGETVDRNSFHFRDLIPAD